MNLMEEVKRLSGIVSENDTYRHSRIDEDLLDERVIPKTIPITAAKAIRDVLAETWFEQHQGGEADNLREVQNFVGNSNIVKKKVVSLIKSAFKELNREYGEEAVY